MGESAVSSSLLSWSVGKWGAAELTIFLPTLQERPEADRVVQDIADYVHNYKIESDLAYKTAFLCLIGQSPTLPAAFPGPLRGDQARSSSRCKAFG